MHIEYIKNYIFLYKIQFNINSIHIIFNLSNTLGKLFFLNRELPWEAIRVAASIAALRRTTSFRVIRAPCNTSSHEEFIGQGVKSYG